MHNPELLSLARIEWQFFCTFTFKSERLTDAIRLSIFFALLRTQAQNFGVHFKHLVWALRRESGESTGRLHFHALIAGLPPSGRTTATCFSTMRLWESLGGGFAKVTVYNPTLDGQDVYCLHCQAVFKAEDIGEDREGLPECPVYAATPLDLFPAPWWREDLVEEKTEHVWLVEPIRGTPGQPKELPPRPSFENN